MMYAVEQTPKLKRLKEYSEILFMFAISLTIGIFWLNLYWPFFPSDQTQDADYSYDGCSVAGIVLHGELATYAPWDGTAELLDEVSASEDITYYIDLAESTEDVRAILLEIDSYGGSPVAAQEIEKALKNATKPTVVQIREAGLSAAYWVATGADTIFASEFSDVGSIGVTQSYVDESKLNELQGYTYNQLSTGEFKDILDPQKPLTDEERDLLERDIQIIYNAFINTVAQNRGLDVDKVRQLADGSSMLGQMALENGLIDRIGGFDEVEEHLTQLVGEEPMICW